MRVQAILLCRAISAMASTARRAPEMAAARARRHDLAALARGRASLPGSGELRSDVGASRAHGGRAGPSQRACADSHPALRLARHR
jgi:hypothetical protein